MRLTFDRLYIAVMLGAGSACGGDLSRLGRASVDVRTVHAPPANNDVKKAPDPAPAPNPAPQPKPSPTPAPAPAPAPAPTPVPPVVASLSAVVGSVVASNTVTVVFGDLPTFATVEVRRGLGSTAPDCTSGTIVKVFSKPFPAKTTFIDQTDTANQTYSYRSCYIDASGAKPSIEQPSATTKPHILFVSPATFDGNLGGISGANAACANLALLTNMPQLRGEAVWQAVLSDSALDASVRVQVLGQVAAANFGATPTYGVLAADGPTLWSSGLNAGPDGSSILDATAHASQAQVWTGSTATGGKTVNTCADWGSAAGAASGDSGDASTLSGTAWLSGSGSAACSAQKAIYCMSEPASMLQGVTGATQPNSVDLTVTPPSQWTVDGYIEIRRRPYPGIPSADCSSALETPILSIHPLTAAATQFTDTQATANKPYNYRACLLDANGNLVFSSLIQHVLTSP